MMLDISYIGNRGSRLNHHFETLGVGANMNDPSVLALGTAGAAVQHQLGPGPQRRHPDRRIPGSTATWPRRCGSSRSTSKSNGAGVPTGRSQYHAMEVVLERRFSRGLQARVGYTYSHLMNNGDRDRAGK